MSPLNMFIIKLAEKYTYVRYRDQGVTLMYSLCKLKKKLIIICKQ